MVKKDWDVEEDVTESRLFNLINELLCDEGHRPSAMQYEQINNENEPKKNYHIKYKW